MTGVGIIADLDYENLRIVLGISSVNGDIDVQLWRDYRASRVAFPEFRLFDPMMDASGNEAKGGGSFTERSFRLRSGVRIVPYDATQLLTIRNTYISPDEGLAGRALFDRSSLSPTTAVDIDVDVPQVEVITVNTGGSAVLPSDVDDIAAAVAAGRAPTDTLVDKLARARGVGGVPAEHRRGTGDGAANAGRTTAGDLVLEHVYSEDGQVVTTTEVPPCARFGGSRTGSFPGRRPRRPWRSRGSSRSSRPSPALASPSSSTRRSVGA